MADRFSSATDLNSFPNFVSNIMYFDIVENAMVQKGNSEECQQLTAIDLLMFAKQIANGMVSKTPFKHTQFPPQNFHPKTITNF